MGDIYGSESLIIFSTLERAMRVTRKDRTEFRRLWDERIGELAMRRRKEWDEATPTERVMIQFFYKSCGGWAWTEEDDKALLSAIFEESINMETNA